KFIAAIQKKGVELDLKSQMLCQGGSVFINGEAQQLSHTLYVRVRELADQRVLTELADCPEALGVLLYEWYLDGYLVVGQIKR
ncbi:MAG: cupin domain-containing protein, partial [Gallionella sp.]|nr:cupin domain-containing protein [Gallionella sp.]